MVTCQARSRGRSVALDGVPDVLGLGHGHRAVHEQADDVDSAWLLLAMRLCAVELEKHSQLSLLALVDRFLRRPEPDATARLDLDEHQRVAVLGDDVDLTEAAAPVASEDAEALFLEVRQRGDLTRVAYAVLEGPGRRKLLGGSRPPATLRRRSRRLRLQPRLRRPGRSPRSSRHRRPPGRR